MKARVAWMDGLLGSPPAATVGGIELTAVPNLGNHSPYRPLDSDIERLKQVTESGECDVVVIGNNTGGGKSLARVVAEAMKDRTIIVFNSPPRHFDRSPYEQMGIRHFGDRADIPSVLDGVLKP